MLSVAFANPALCAGFPGSEREVSGNRSNKVICLVPPGPRDQIARFPEHWEACFVHRNDDLTAELTEGARALLTTHPYLVGRTELELLNGVELVQQVGVGIDNIDVAAARELGVPVCNVPQANAVSVAEYVIMACIFLLRRMEEATAALRRLENPYPALFVKGSHEVRGKRLGLIGYGAIAHEVAKRALEMELLSASAPERERERRLAPSPDERQLGVERMSFERLLREADVVSLHVPLTDSTRDLIGARELGLMKPSAFLINTSRGGIVNEEELAAALSCGRIAGAAIDVFSVEPIRSDNPLLSAPNAFLSPHSGGSTNECVIDAIRESIANVDRVLRGEEPHHRVC